MRSRAPAGRKAVVFALLAAADFATLTLIGASPVPGLDDLTVTGFGFTFGGLVLLPFAAVSGLAFRPGPAAIGLLIALGTGPTAAAYTLYFRGLRGAPAARRRCSRSSSRSPPRCSPRCCSATG
ncbi:MAG TPA: EamA family transporter [Trebonia sp.]|nr:EamA family transporter [Trebonia sp.]